MRSANTPPTIVAKPLVTSSSWAELTKCLGSTTFPTTLTSATLSYIWDSRWTAAISWLLRCSALMERLWELMSCLALTARTDFHVDKQTVSAGRNTNQKMGSCWFSLQRWAMSFQLNLLECLINVHSDLLSNCWTCT